ncbi:MAG: glycosyltransferase family 4 protein [Planctomycetaceae bacterium]
MHVAIITAGGAGMFCGSCMHDNTLANALQAAGAEVSLIPTYTPIRVDERNVSEKTVFLGGINVYLESQSRIWRAVPAGLKRWLDKPWAINLATRFGVSNNARKLGKLTLDMLAGEAGPIRRAYEELASHLAALSPDVICFSNALLSGAVRSIRERMAAPVFCLLQGDDIFLNDLPAEFREAAISSVSEQSTLFDGFLVHSTYYLEFMSDYLRLPKEKFYRVPLGIDFSGHDGTPTSRTADDLFTVGYFARICPEKGLHNLLEAFRIFHNDHPHSRLRFGGSLTQKDRKYFRKTLSAFKDLQNVIEHIGSPATHQEKVTFLQSLDVLSVPTTYREPKGIYVLEALANGVPVVQPRHGSFPELLEATGGGLLVEPENPQDLARGLSELYRDVQKHAQLAECGYQNVRKHFGPQTMAQKTLEVFQQVLDPSGAVSTE